MKLQSLHFLTKSNIKGNKNSGTITLLICLLTVAVTVISCFSVTTVNAVNRYKEDYKARSLSLAPVLQPLTDEALKAISGVEHVELVADVTGMPYAQGFGILETSSKDISNLISANNSYMFVHRLYEGEEKSVIRGKKLKDAPDFTCLVPSIFYPVDDGISKNREYIDGTSLIGETITITGINDVIEFSYFDSFQDGCVEQVNERLPSPEFTLTIVGTYFCSHGTSGNSKGVYVSEETGLQMMETVIEEAGIDLSENTSSVARWWNTSSQHEYLVVVDEYDNISEVYNSVKKIGYSIASRPLLLPDESTMLMATLFKNVGTFLTVAVVFLAVIILIQSSVNSIRERKGFIGLMKAIGYKNHQIFASLIYEQLYMTLKAFLIGGAISTAVVLVANYFFSHGTYRQMKYIIDMKVYLIFLGVSFLIALLVPLVTQLLLLRKLVKIQPREAMNTR